MQAPRMARILGMACGKPPLNPRFRSFALRLFRLGRLRRFLLLRLELLAPKSQALGDALLLAVLGGIVIPAAFGQIGLRYVASFEIVRILVAAAVAEPLGTL